MSGWGGGGGVSGWGVCDWPGGDVSGQKSVSGQGVSDEGFRHPLGGRPPGRQTTPQEADQEADPPMDRVSDTRM